MEIKLSEDNGFLFGGVPTLVVVTVTFDNGKVVRFPYQAEKAISALYEDLSRVNVEEVAKSFVLEVARPKEVKLSVPRETVETVTNQNEIEREDIVTCIKVEDRGQGATVDLHVGGEYRVLKVHAQSVTLADGLTKRVVNGYDIVDDTAPVQFRTFVAAHEVALARKHGPKPKKFLTKEVDLKCPGCGEVVYCGLQDGFYSGECQCGEAVGQTKEEWDREHPMPKVAVAA